MRNPESRRSAPLLIIAAAFMPFAYAAPISQAGAFMPVNGSPVAGTATVVRDGDQLTVTINATGLEPGTHPQHIHGPFVSPPTDLDGDGWIETPEAAVPAIGPILLNLVPYPAGSTVAWTNTYTVDPATLLPLTDKVVELHGRSVPPGAGTLWRWQVWQSRGCPRVNTPARPTAQSADADPFAWRP